MKNYSLTLGRTSLLSAGILLLVGAQATGQIGYEGFDTPKLSAVPSIDAPDGTDLAAITATGYGFENWIVTNKGVAGSSRYVTAGLSYPANYDGSFVATGGSAVISGELAGNATHSLMFDATVLAAVSGSDTVWFSFLAERTGPTSVSTVDPINETALYPRNFGVRYLNGAGNSNSNMGTLGSAASWSTATDEWGQFGAKDTHNLTTSEPIAGNVDMLVVGVTNASTAAVVSIWVNPDSTSTSPDIWYNFTDGTPLPFALTGIGTEAGNTSGERMYAEWSLDEINVGLDALSGAGLSNLVAVVAVPEPSFLGSLLGCFAVGMAFIRRRR